MIDCIYWTLIINDWLFGLRASSKDINSCKVGFFLEAWHHAILESCGLSPEDRQISSSIYTTTTMNGTTATPEKKADDLHPMSWRLDKPPSETEFGINDVGPKSPKMGAVCARS